MDLFNSSFFTLFFVVAVGFILGKIKIKGFSFDISAILFLALFMGYLGVSLPKEFQTLGLILFIYTIGIQAGPGFFESFKQQGRKLFLMAAILIGSAALVTVGVAHFFSISSDLAAGLFTGALTSTPGLAAAIDSTGSTLASIGYGIAYPFGVIGVILFIKVIPKILKTDIKQAEEKYSQDARKLNPELLVKTFKVTKAAVTEKSIGKIKLRRMTGAVISRVKHNDETFTPTSATCLFIGDLVRMVGPQESFEQVETLIGPEVSEEIHLSKQYRVQSVLLTNSEVVGKTLQQINLSHVYNATVTRVRRSGIDLAPNPTLKLQMGDKIMVACSMENMKNVTSVFGNNDQRLSDTDFFPIAVGIVLGILAGKLSISFSDKFTFTPGLTGGILFVSLMLGRLGKTGPVLWSMTGAATQTLRQMGLIFFLATVGTNAGSTLVESLNNYGAELFIAGALITLLPMIISTVFCRFFLKMDILELLGALTGGMTSTPGLASIESTTSSEAPKVAYATIYPIAMVLLILCLQFII